MVHATAQADLFPTPDGVVVVNDRCVLRADGDQRAVVLAGLVLWHFAVGDRMAEAHAMVSLVEQGWADQDDVARAFGYSARTVRRLQRRYEQGGLVNLRRVVGYPRGRPRLRSRDRLLGKLKGAGLSNRAIAHKLGISEKAVRKRLRRLGWTAAPPEQVSLPIAMPSPLGADPNLSASAQTSTTGADQSVFSGAPVELEPIATTFDRDPMDRRLDRLFAYLGLLDDAAPLFQAGTQVPSAGVLMALPSLIHSGVFALARKTYGSIGPAFYGLRTTILTLLLMALLRIKRPEALKEHSPPELGRVLGLDRAPEVKTLRRKLTRLAGLGEADRLGRLLAERRVAVRGQTLGFLYVDGHVRVYHGRRDLPKAHVARMRLALPATTDYWVNDQEGDPLFVLTAEANAAMVKMLPQILNELRSLIGERRLTIVFDRGGFSPTLFDQLIREGFDILTYRKGRFPKLPIRCFKEYASSVGGREIRYHLDDRGVQLLGRKLRLRQVTRLKGGHQTPPSSFCTSASSHRGGGEPSCANAGAVEAATCPAGSRASIATRRCRHRLSRRPRRLMLRKRRRGARGSQASVGPHGAHRVDRRCPPGWPDGGREDDHGQQRDGGGDRRRIEGRDPVEHVPDRARREDEGEGTQDRADRDQAKRVREDHAQQDAA
jgi:transposase